MRKGRRDGSAIDRLAISMSDSPPAELFEPTPRTAVIEMLDGRRPEDVRAFLMSHYYEPLAAYISAVDRGVLGEPRDVIGGFFADRLDRPEWLERWRESGLRLRKWLVNGLHFYCREQQRRRRRDATVDLVSENIPPSIDTVVERAYATATVRRATEMASAACAHEGYTEHWACFMRHHMGDATYEQLAAETTHTPGQVANMVRTAARRFRSALGELLLRDGADPADLDLEIGQLLSTLGNH